MKYTLNIILIFIIFIIVLLSGCTKDSDLNSGKPITDEEMALMENVLDPPKAIPEPENPLDDLIEESDNEDLKITLNESSRNFFSTIEPDGEVFSFGFNYRITTTQRRPNPDNPKYIVEGPTSGDFTLTITNAADPENKLQEIEFGSLSDWGIDSFYKYILDSIRILDFNFDGYNDILVVSYANSGSKGYFDYNCWLWNPQSEQFEDYGMGDFGHIYVNSKEQFVLTLKFSIPEENYRLYKPSENGLVLTETLTLYEHMGIGARENPDGTVIANYIENDTDSESQFTIIEATKLQDGEIVDVFPEIIGDTPEGQQELSDYLNRSDSLVNKLHKEQYIASLPLPATSYDPQN